MAYQNDLTPSVGSKLYVVDNAVQPVSFDLTGYEALIYTECGYITEIPAFGSSYAVDTRRVLGSRTPTTSKGFVDFGSISIPMGRVSGDDGQKILSVAIHDDRAYSFKIETSQKTGIDSVSLTSFYFAGKVFEYLTNIGGADSIVMSNVSITIDRFPVIVEDEKDTYNIIFNEYNVISGSNNIVLEI